MGHIYLDIEILHLYFNKNGIFNTNLNLHLNYHIAQIQNLITKNNKIKFNQTLLHNKIFKIIQEHNFHNNYLLHQNSIISTIISNNKNLKKQNKKNINKYKKKIADILNSEQMKNCIEFENK